MPVTAVNRGIGAPSASSLRRITSLSWACTSASGGGATVTPSATRVSSMAVGTCSWSNVRTSAPASRPAQGVEVGVLADHHIRADLGGRIVGADGEDSQALAEGDRRLVGHPGQLSAANHGDDRRSGGV